MTSEADWIKEVSKTYLEEAKKTTGVPAGATEDKFDAARKEIKKAGHKAKLGKGVPAGEVKEEIEECGECLDEMAQTAARRKEMQELIRKRKATAEKHADDAREVDFYGQDNSSEAARAAHSDRLVAQAQNRNAREKASKKTYDVGGKVVEESTITNEQLLESFQHLSEEQFDALTDKYLTHLSENYTEDQIAAMTEEQLQEGLMDFARGLVKTGVEKAKELGGKVKQGIKDIEQKGAVAGFEAEKSKIRKGGSQAGHHLQQLAAGKALGSTGASGQQEIRPEDEQLHQSLASAYDKSVKQRTKGLGGFAAKVKGKLTGKSAEDVIRSGDEAKLAKLQKAGAIKGAELAGRYRSGTQKAAQQKLAALRGQIAKYKKLTGDTE